jgi:predicted ester cyclase
VKPGSEPAVTTADNKEIVRRLMEEVLGQGRFKLLTELVAADYVGHFALGDHYGPEGFQIAAAAYRTAFPDLTVTLDDLLADGDKVVRRYTLQGTHHESLLGEPATGQRLTLQGIAIDRLADGLLVETWAHIGRLP